MLRHQTSLLHNEVSNQNGLEIHIGVHALSNFFLIPPRKKGTQLTRKPVCLSYCPVTGKGYRDQGNLKRKSFN